MSKNLKNYAAVRTALEKLQSQLKDETKSNPRFKRGHGRVLRMLSMLKIAEGKYEIVHGRGAPSAKKVAKAKAAAKKSGGRAVKKAQEATVTRLRAVG